MRSQYRKVGRVFKGMFFRIQKFVGGSGGHRWCFLMVFSVMAVGTWSPPLFAQDEEDQRRELHLYLKGRYLFQKQCSTCHGMTGRGDGPWAAGLKDKPRNFRVGVFKFRTTPFGMLPAEDDLRRTIRSGISGTAMPFFKDLSEEDVSSLIVFIRSLSREWDKEELRAEPFDLPKTPHWFADASEKSEHAEAARGVFEATCAVCHGSGGKGDGPGSKGLVDIWGNAITPATLAAEHHKSGDDPDDLYRTIATGLNGTPMVGYGSQFKPEEIWDLVAFVMELPREKGDEGENQKSAAGGE
jgi:cytochrome c oxidase cbb3-type subunit 2